MRNLRTGYISPQFHVVYDELFTTVHSVEENNETWINLFTNKRDYYGPTEENEDEEFTSFPELTEDWLPAAESPCAKKEEMMSHLQVHKLLYVSNQTGKREWNTQTICREVVASSNVIELIANKVLRLSSATTDILTLAAFMGTTVDVELLKKGVHLMYPKKPITTVMDALEVCAKEQQIDMKVHRRQFSFLHERVAAIAYEMIPHGPKRKSLHLQIGMCLQSVFLKNETSTHTCEKWELNLTVDQLNRGSDHLKDANQRLELAELNPQAAELVMAVSAFKMSSKFLEMAVKLLGVHRWESKYDLTMYVSNVLARSLFAIGEITATLDVVREICAKVKCSEERYEAQYLHGNCLLVMTRVDEAIKVGPIA